MRRELGRPRHRPTRGQEAIRWIEMHCVFPDGPRRGERVVLTQEERDLVRRIYDDGGWYLAIAAIRLGSSRRPS
jgi:hypothetical protein